MAMVTLAAPSTKITKSLSFANSTNFRDASFSSYLDGAEENFILQLSKSSQDLNPAIISNSKPNEQLFQGRKKEEDGEIDIFGAEKYFNEGVDEENQRVSSRNIPNNYNHKKDDLHEAVSVKQIRKPRTPSVRSESSWNSRSSLLHNVPRNQPSKTNKIHQGKSFLASLGCNCSCSDKNSVDIDEHPAGSSISKRRLMGGQVRGNVKQSVNTGNLVRIHASQLMASAKEEMSCKSTDEQGFGSTTEDRIGFPGFSSNPAITLQLQPHIEDDLNRKSLEVFGSPISDKGKKSLDLEKRVTMISWDAITPSTSRLDSVHIPTNDNGMYNDTDSDASSDLFEIESFSTNTTNPFVGNGRQASDGMSSYITPTCYAPSEASIEWSVVTASAADFSVVSDSEESRTTITTINPHTHRKVPTAGINRQWNKEMPRRRPGILSGCKSQKAVRIAEDAYRANDKHFADQRRYPIPMSESFAPMFHADQNKLPVRYDIRDQHSLLDARPITRSHSGRAAHLLYI